MSRRRWIVLAATAAVVALAAPTIWAYSASAGRILSNPAEAPSEDVTMVMGAGVRADGVPSRLLAGRLDVAAALYHLGRTRTLLVSGGTAPGGYDEPAAMRRYLESAGVPAEAIVEDPLGVDTWASCVRARDEFGLSRLLVVSQRFHLPRTVALCRSLGLDAVGVAHDSKDSNPPGTRQGYVREVAASVPAMVRAIFG
ncbi:SanA/YdcF family protein [Jiangella alkaliphila]|uniref:Protein SanA, affects membrane permeability for vancomycin n=1 Tax=Jiangella alkaliphila TaxID=419479 RepID=A0A1H2L3Z5_9ACTN|nr:ElyC/SanA/YdcF family protein [Jiangella alkaliphila]SDU75720.1 protein SanA, affects membrane permeability for vancomycin [Jiangella alkaliphila]